MEILNQGFYIINTLKMSIFPSHYKWNAQFASAFTIPYQIQQ